MAHSTAQFDLKLRNISWVSPGREWNIQYGDFAISQGQKWLIHGSSGGGKTTLLHLIAGLLRPATGDIHWGKVNLNEFSTDETAYFRQRNMGLLFQKLNLFSFLKAEEMLDLGRIGAHSEERRRGLIQDLQLAPLMQKKVSHLSVGQQQKLALARALLHPSPIYLLDEPTSSLDEISAQAVMETILKYTTGSTVILVSHDQRLRPHFKNIIDIGELIK